MGLPLNRYSLNPDSGGPHPSHRGPTPRLNPKSRISSDSSRFGVHRFSAQLGATTSIPCDSHMVRDTLTWLFRGGELEKLLEGGAVGGTEGVGDPVRRETRAKTLTQPHARVVAPFGCDFGDRSVRDGLDVGFAAGVFAGADGCVAVV